MDRHNISIADYACQVKNLGILMCVAMVIYYIKMIRKETSLLAPNLRVCGYAIDASAHVPIAGLDFTNKLAT